jgi:hypothetical protein
MASAIVRQTYETLISPDFSAPPMRLSRFFFLLLASCSGLSAAEFSVQIVDGLSRPVPGVHVVVSCRSHRQEDVDLHLQSAHDGIVHASYDAALCSPDWVSVEKPGYQSFFSGFRRRYVLLRQFDPEELLRVIKLEGDEQQQELRELLAGDFSRDGSRFGDLVFYHEARLRPLLRTLVHDPEVTGPARDLLASIGVSEDLNLILQLASSSVSAGLPARWRYVTATALVNPDTEDEWLFLRRCALNEFDDRWVGAGAIQTLKLTGSARSRTVLEEAQRKNKAQASRISNALDYIKSNPRPLADSDLKALAKRVGKALALGKWEGNGPPQFNEAADKALIDLRFQTSADLLVYTATFHRREGRWELRGAHETYQAFALH